jgi:hypothetical protein
MKFLAITTPLIFALLLLCWIIFGIKNFPQKQIPEVSFENESKICEGRYLYKIIYENHSYIYLRNTWSSSGDRLIHDPGCKCKLNKEIKSEEEELDLIPLDEEEDDE